MRKSNCVCCKEGVVLDENCDKVISHYLCSIDAWDESVHCTHGGCIYYEKKESEVNNA